METKKTSKSLLGAGVFTAIIASLCCITPVIALVAGGSGMASAFSWLEPARPYLLGITIAVLGLAWYLKLKPAKVEVECACEEDDAEGRKYKRSFWQSKGFLAIVTVFAILMMAFPKYSSIFYPENKPDTEISSISTIQTVNLGISGMTCTGCEEHIEYAVSEVPGFVEASADYKTGEASVTFDAGKTTSEDIVQAVVETGYKVTDLKKEK